MTNEQQPAGQGRGVVESAEWISVLERLKEALPTVGLNGWTSGVAALEWAIAALTQPKGIDWQPSADTVKKVIRALTRLGHSTPESPEVVAIQIDQWLMTLCRELDSFMDSLPRQSEAEPFGYFDSQGLAHAGNSTNFRMLLEAHRAGKPDWRDLKLLYTTPQPAQADTMAVIEKHRRHVELSPGVGADVQKYALAVIDDILADLPTPAAHGVGDDTKRIDWLEANEADLCLTRQLENEGGEYSLWWNVIGELGSISGHPLACPREAIDAAMLQAASAPGGGNG